MAKTTARTDAYDVTIHCRVRIGHPSGTMDEAQSYEEADLAVRERFHIGEEDDDVEIELDLINTDEEDPNE
jgi:hypothetical protein